MLRKGFLHTYLDAESKMLEVQDAGVVLQHLPVDLNKRALQLQGLLVPLPGLALWVQCLSGIVHERLRSCMPVGVDGARQDYRVCGAQQLIVDLDRLDAEEPRPGGGQVVDGHMDILQQQIHDLQATLHISANA